ncbi:MAG: ABC transporter substrate-binding protein [Gemmatimonas sp.]
MSASLRRSISKLLSAISVIGAVGILAGAVAEAADLPKATQKALTALKLGPSALDGLDAELAVPAAWIDAARRERDVIVYGTWNEREFSTMTAPFKERYPFITVKYDRSGTSGRGTRVLVALGEGRVIADVMTSIADGMPEFMKAKALADLRDLPAFKSIPEDYVASDGTWSSFKLSFRCMAYNTEKVKKQDLPASWDDLLTNPVWRGGHLALSDHPNAWLLSLWSANGDAWGRDFTRRLFVDLQPQRRKEGMTQSTALTVAGEFYANIPSPEWTAKRYSVKGAPIGYHCPAPVPISTSQVVMLDKSPRKNASRIFVNWLLSREGQLLQYAETFAVPVHKDLRSSDFLPFPDTILGKPTVIRDESLLGDELQNTVQEVWNGYWSGKASLR